ncbi:MAG: hypothetical protein FWC80_05630, partial [Firmicutes bacterium]|nr:hypothetical protein [Bacillota bacterium]
PERSEGSSEAKNTKNTSFYSFLSANARSFASLRMTDQQCLSSKIGFRYKSNDDIYIFSITI